MEPEAVAPERDFLGWCLRQSAVPHHKLTALRPDFLVISPPKTGSTWLTTNLRRHPAVFIPKIKEVKYFSRYFKWLDLNWYLEQFAPGTGRIKGEASPSYAILPLEKIRLIRRLMPDVKLLFLMRDPVSRAWSHAKHNYRYREANFSTGAGALEFVTDGQWGENFRHEWPLNSGDYLGQLRRWLSVFPREQMFIGFFEDIAARPEALLCAVFAFLGVPSDVDLAGYPVRERVLSGLAADLTPSLTQMLRRLLYARTQELVSFLSNSIGLKPPPEWEGSFRAPDNSGPVSIAAFAQEFDDDYLARVLAQEELFPSSPTPVLEGYRGHDIVFYRGRLYALAEEIGDLCVNEIDEAQLWQHQDAGRCFVAPSLPEVKELVDRHVLNRTREQLRSAHADILRLEGCLRRTEETLTRLETEVSQLTPWYATAARWARAVWRDWRASTPVTAGVDRDEEGEGCRRSLVIRSEKRAAG